MASSPQAANRVSAVQMGLVPGSGFGSQNPGLRGDLVLFALRLLVYQGLGGEITGFGERQIWDESLTHVTYHLGREKKQCV